MIAQPNGRRPSLLLQPWQKNLYTIVLAETIAMIGFSIAQPFLAFYLQDLGVRSVEEVAFWVGLISSLQPICLAVSAPVWGIVADRYGRKPMLARAMFGGGIALVLSGLAANPQQLMAFRMLEGLLAGTVAAATTLVAVTTPPEHRGYGLGLLQTAMFTGNFLGPLIGGAIASTLGYRVAFIISGATLCATGLLVLALVQEAFVRPAPRQHKGSSLRTMVRGLARNPLLMSMLALLAVQHASVNVTIPVLPLYVQGIVPDLKQASATMGTIMGFTALSTAVSSVWVGRSADRLGRRRVLVACLIVGALSYLPQGLTQHPWQLLALRIITGLSMGGISPVVNAIIAESASDGGHGGIYGFSASLNSIGRALGPVLGAFVVAGWGVPSVFPVSGLLLLLVAALVAWRTRSLESSLRRPSSS